MYIHTQDYQILLALVGLLKHQLILSHMKKENDAFDYTFTNFLI